MRRICVYTICKNEIKNAERWLRSVVDADLVYVYDTGSTDGTPEFLIGHNKKNKALSKEGGGYPFVPNLVVHEIDEYKRYENFRFDEARNIALNGARKVINEYFKNPDDSWVFISLDFDEFIVEGGINNIRNNFKDEYDTMRFIAINDNSTHETSHKIHSDSEKWEWIRPVHEIIHRNDKSESEWVIGDACASYHHIQDLSKERDYYGLLKESYKNGDESIKTLIYIAWEAFNLGNIQEFYDFSILCLKKLFKDNPEDPDNGSIEIKLQCYLNIIKTDLERIERDPIHISDHIDEALFIISQIFNIFNGSEFPKFRKAFRDIIIFEITALNAIADLYNVNRYLYDRYLDTCKFDLLIAACEILNIKERPYCWIDDDDCYENNSSELLIYSLYHNKAFNNRSILNIKENDIIASVLLTYANDDFKNNSPEYPIFIEQLKLNLSFYEADMDMLTGYEEEISDIIMNRESEEFTLNITYTDKVSSMESEMNENDKVIKTWIEYVDGISDIPNDSPIKNKICVYAICKNESQFVDKWVESMKEADSIVVLDTGSTDDTVEKLRSHGVKVEVMTINPWRFDVARNVAMLMAPSDCNILVSTDLDEILEPGWADILREKWIDGVHERAEYKYSWSHLKNGDSGRVFHYNKIHSRNWVWKYPVHELLWNYKTCTENYPHESSLYLFDYIHLHHYPDYSKSRSSYLPLLELRAKENKEDYYGLIYLAHEYYYQNHFQKSIDTLTFILENFANQYSSLEQASCYLFMGDDYMELKNYSKAMDSYLKAINIDPTYREPYLNLGKAYMAIKDYDNAIRYIKISIKETYRHYTWLERDISWTYEPYDLLSLAAYYGGYKRDSLGYAMKALSIEPTNERLKNNVDLILASTSDMELISD